MQRLGSLDWIDAVDGQSVGSSDGDDLAAEELPFRVASEKDTLVGLEQDGDGVLCVAPAKAQAGIDIGAELQYFKWIGFRRDGDVAEVVDGKVDLQWMQPNVLIETGVAAQPLPIGGMIEARIPAAVIGFQEAGACAAGEFEIGVEQTSVFVARDEEFVANLGL